MKAGPAGLRLTEPAPHKVVRPGTRARAWGWQAGAEPGSVLLQRVPVQRAQGPIQTPDRPSVTSGVWVVMLRGALIVFQRRPVQCSSLPGFSLATDQVPTHTLLGEATASPAGRHW